MSPVVCLFFCSRYMKLPVCMQNDLGFFHSYYIFIFRKSQCDTYFSRFTLSNVVDDKHNADFYENGWISQHR